MDAFHASSWSYLPYAEGMLCGAALCAALPGRGPAMPTVRFSIAHSWHRYLLRVLGLPGRTRGVQRWLARTSLTPTCTARRCVVYGYGCRRTVACGEGGVMELAGLCRTAGRGLGTVPVQEPRPWHGLHRCALLVSEAPCPNAVPAAPRQRYARLCAPSACPFCLLPLWPAPAIRCACMVHAYHARLHEGVVDTTNPLHSNDLQLQPARRSAYPPCPAKARRPLCAFRRRTAAGLCLIGPYGIDPIAPTPTAPTALPARPAAPMLPPGCASEAHGSTIPPRPTAPAALPASRPACRPALPYLPAPWCPLCFTRSSRARICRAPTLRTPSSPAAPSARTRRARGPTSRGRTSRYAKT